MFDLYLPFHQRIVVLLMFPVQFSISTTYGRFIDLLLGRCKDSIVYGLIVVSKDSIVYGFIAVRLIIIQ
jgi:hypothetical protein